jgi:Asp-tRNA(Asn)/Glu-tRNA(Gln) amidotransferase A subunit family amidase
VFVLFVHMTHFDRPLHGIPILVKDNIATKDKLDASAG